jgi:imidazolonepropionase-like amidohydrolase
MTTRALSRRSLKGEGGRVTHRREHIALVLLSLAIPVQFGGGVAVGESPHVIVLDHVRLIDGTGSPARDNMQIVIRDDRIDRVSSGAQEALPNNVERIDLSGHTVMPGLIDLHFHVEDDPKLALRQLANGVTSFRDPGQWIEQYEGLRASIAVERLPGPRMALTGPHIDGEHPAYPRDSYVARDPEDARRTAERNVADGASALKIYFRLPLASARAVIEVCRAHAIPCTAHLELLDAREVLRAGLDAIEHITSFGTSVVPRRRAERYRQQVLLENDARRDGRYVLFADADFDGADARELYEVLQARRPFLNPTLAAFEVRADARRKDAKVGPQIDRRGFVAMKRLTFEAFRHGARITLGGHSTVPFAKRGEAPWRELELLVESGLTPLEALTAATATGAASLRRSQDLGTVEAGKLADLVVLQRDPSADIHAIRTVDRVMLGGRWVDVKRYRTW